MSKDLETYKKNRIDSLKNTYKSTVNSLYSTLMINIRRVSSSKNRNKQSLINSLISQYNNIVNYLTQQLNIEINKVNAFQPVFKVSSTNNKKALLIGVNYTGTPYELFGCVDDTNRMKECLVKFGFNQFNIITDNTTVKPTKDSILRELRNMVRDSRDGDMLFFYFSGHGSYTYDTNGDESDRKDEMIISSDLKGVLDDELKTILSNNMKEGVTIVGLFDSCHSGTMFDLKYNYLNSENYDKYTENERVSECRGNVLMISGCMDSQTSSEAIINDKPQGAVSWAFIQSVNEKESLSWRELLQSMRDILKTSRFTQIPQMSTDSFYDIDSKVFL